jgi:hypothetical protein
MLHGDGELEPVDLLELLYNNGELGPPMLALLLHIPAPAGGNRKTYEPL